MNEIEYKVDVFRADFRMRSGYQDELDYLNKMGSTGWVLCCVDKSSLSFGSDTYYWMRPKK